LFESYFNFFVYFLFIFGIPNRTGIRLSQKIPFLNPSPKHPPFSLLAKKP